MAETLQPTVRTVVTPAEMYDALKAAWSTQVGTTPTRVSLLVLLSQWSLETGNGSACMNFNCAGIKHVAGDGRDYTTYDTIEYIRGVRTPVNQPFRAYPNLELGVADYLAVLRKTFGYAWPAVEAGDLKDFAHRLRVRGYYTAPEAQYALGLENRYTALDREIPSDPQDAVA